jgi:SNF2 family DNA or RNA helicase
MDMTVVFDSFSIPLSRFRKHILNGTCEFVLPDKTVVILPEEWFQRFHDLFLYGTDTEKGIRIKKMYAGLLNESVAGLFHESKMQELRKFRRLPDERPVLSASMDKILRPYQKEGFRWLVHLYGHGLGGCLSDDMGLGKTLQTISLLEYIYSKSGQKEAKPTSGQAFDLFTLWESVFPASLVVVPKSLLHNWQNELKKFAPGLKTYLYAGNKRVKTKDLDKIFTHYQVVITSYSMVRSDIEYLREYPFLYIILDESQTVRNPDSLLYQSVKQLNSSHKWALTGTPVENSLSDLWAQFNFINPGLLGALSFFKKHYVQQIKAQNTYAEESLKQLIQPFLLRRTKEEVAPDLPPLSEEIVYCDMTEQQQDIYETEKNRIRNILLENKENVTKNLFIALQGLTRLRLLANHPALIDTAYTDDSGKFEQILIFFESIRESGHKVLIFSSFVKHLKLLSATFDSNGWKYAMLTGQTEKREAEIDKFTRNDDVNCFFISLKAGGVGLNLTAADYVFIIDPWWNPAAEMQALSRAHRIGQQKNVIVYRFISSDSIEEKIIRLQQSKLQLSETFITSNNPLDQLNSQEIEELLK